MRRHADTYGLFGESTNPFPSNTCLLFIVVYCIQQVVDWRAGRDSTAAFLTNIHQYFHLTGNLYLTCEISSIQFMGHDMQHFLPLPHYLCIGQLSN